MDDLCSSHPWGVCFPARCPMCARDSLFRLSSQYFGENRPILIHGVVCDNCSYALDATNDEERRKLLQAQKLWERHENGELDASAITDALDALELETLARLIADARTWPCPQCRNENPLHFVTCWNCNYERPMTEEEKRFEQSPPVPDDEMPG